MKRTIILLFAFCLGMFQTANAANTDVSTIDNVVYIEPISVEAGSQYTISVKMKNTVEAQGYGFVLYLPDGASFVVDDGGLPMVEMSTARTTGDKTDAFYSAVRPNGSLHLFASSTGGQTIEGNDGEIAKVTIKVGDTMAQGDYPLKLKEVTVTDLNSVGYDTEEVETTLTVTAPADTRTVLDEDVALPIKKVENVDVRVKRTIAKDVWNTICLPFAMYATQVKAAFGDGVKLGSFKSWKTTAWNDDDKPTAIEVTFEEETEIAANTPYIIKTENDITEFKADGVTIDPEDEPTIIVGNKSQGTFGSFTGTYSPGTVIDEKCLFLNGNNFWYSTGLTKTKGYRAYFYFQDVLASYNSNSTARMKIMLDETTGMNDAVRQEKGEAANDKWYTIGGLSLEGEPTAKGVYVNNGRVIIK